MWLRLRFWSLSGGHLPRPEPGSLSEFLLPRCAQCRRLGVALRVLGLRRGRGSAGRSDRAGGHVGFHERGWGGPLTGGVEAQTRPPRKNRRSARQENRLDRKSGKWLVRNLEPIVNVGARSLLATRGAVGSHAGV